MAETGTIVFFKATIGVYELKPASQPNLCLSGGSLPPLIESATNYNFQLTLGSSPWTTLRCRWQVHPRGAVG